MTDRPLASLDLLRQEALHAAQQKLAEARAELSQREALYNEARAGRARCEEALQSERGQFGEARSVQRLRLVEEGLRGLAQELARAVQREQRALEACSAARARVERELAALGEAERERRAVRQVIDLRREAADKKREQSEEDEAEDAFRGRRN